MTSELGPIVGRVPPNSLDSEGAALSAVLLSSDSFDDIQGLLKPEHFYSNANRLLFEAVCSLHESGSPVDLVSVANWLRDRGRLGQIGGTPYIAQLVDATPAVAHLVHHANEIRGKWRLRQLIQVCQRVSGEGYGDCGPVQEFIDHAERAVYEIAASEERSEMVELREVVGRCYQQAAEAAERGGAITGVAVGITELDRKTSGAHAGDLWIIAGRPGHGKTALGLGMVRTICAPRAAGFADTPDANGDSTAYEPGGVAAYMTLEMPKEQIGNRLLAQETKIDLGRLRTGHIGQGEWAKMVEAVSRLSQASLWIDDTPALTMLELRSKCRRLDSKCQREGRKLAAIVVDHVGLMDGEREKGESREQEVSRLSRGLKVLAKELAVPVLALCQLNRDCEKRPDKRPQLSDLRDSGSLEQDADNIVFVYRDEMYHKESVDAGLAELILAKNRNGATGTVKAKWTAHCARFDSLASEEEWDDAAPGDYPEPDEAELRYP